MSSRKKARLSTEEVLCMLELDSGANVYPEDSSSDDEDLSTQLNCNYGSGESDSDYIPSERYVVSVLL